MDNNFIYNKPVTGKNFIGKREDSTIVTNLLRQGENIAVYGAPKSGKTSLIRQAIFNLKLEGNNIVVAEVNLQNVRDTTTFISNLGNAVAHAFATTPGEYQQLIQKYLNGTHFVFDPQRYSDYDEIISFNWDPDDNDLKTILRLPFNIAAGTDKRLFLVFNEFQNIELCEDADNILKQMEAAMSENRGDIENCRCSVIFEGSRYNAMKSIFGHHRYFYRLVENFETTPVERNEIVQYINRTLMSRGKVIDVELAAGACEIFQNNIWYILHYMSICDHLSKGFITEAVLMDALDMIISLHEPYFRAITDELTTFQINLLRAVVEGQTKFSSAETIRKYRLNSSANVKRLREALMKKEVLSFNEKDEPKILDPLFEHWFKNFYLK